MAFSVVNHPRNFNTKIILEKNDVAGSLVMARHFNNVQYSKYIADNYKTLKPFYNLEYFETGMYCDSLSVSALSVNYFYRKTENPYLNYYFEIEWDTHTSGTSNSYQPELYWRGSASLMTGTALLLANVGTNYYWQGSIYIPDIDGYDGGLPVGISIRLYGDGINGADVIKFNNVYLSGSDYSILSTVDKGTP